MVRLLGDVRERELWWVLSPAKLTAVVLWTLQVRSDQQM